MMTTKERLQAELERRTEEDMAELLRIRQSRAQSRYGTKPILFSKLRQVHMGAPEDFAANLDQYVSLRPMKRSK